MEIEIETFTSGLPVITAFTAGLVMILQMVLMVNVGRMRGKTDTLFGIGTDERLQLAIRAHGNLTENAPMFLLVFAFLEVLGAPIWAVATLCAVFFVARLLHAIGLSNSGGTSATRFAGALGTLLTGVIGGLYLTWMGLMAIMG